MQKYPRWLCTVLWYAIVDVSQSVSETVLSRTHGGEVTDVTFETGMGTGECSLTAELHLKPDSRL